MSQQKWTQDMRRKLYSRLTKEIAPHRNWDAKIRPIWKRKEFDVILVELSKEFSAQTGQDVAASAIQQQINFATTTQAELKNQSHIRSYILNKAAALEVGFIESKELPVYLRASDQESGKVTSSDIFKDLLAD